VSEALKFLLKGSRGGRQEAGSRWQRRFKVQGSRVLLKQVV